MAPTKQRFGALPLSKAVRAVTAVYTTTSDTRDDKENIYARAHGTDHSKAQPKASTLTAQQRSSEVRINVTTACSLSSGVSTHHMEPAELPGGLACSAGAAAVQQQEPDARVDSHTPYTQLAATYISPTPEQLPPAVRRRPLPPEQQVVGWNAAAQQVGIGPRQTAQCCHSHRWQRITGPASPEGVLPPFMKRMLLLTEQHRVQQPAPQLQQHNPQLDSHQQQRQLRHQGTRKRGVVHLEGGDPEPQHKKRTTSFIAQAAHLSGAAVHRDRSSVSLAGQVHCEAVAKVPAPAPASSAYDVVAETPQQAITTSPTAVTEAGIQPTTAEAGAVPASTRCYSLGVVVETPIALQPALQQPQTVSISVVEPTPLTEAVVSAAQQPATIFATSSEAASWRGPSAAAGQCWGGPHQAERPVALGFNKL